MTSRLGTHIIEFILGRMCNRYNGFDSFDKCVYQLVKSQVTKEILENINKVQIRIFVQGSYFFLMKLYNNA